MNKQVRLFLILLALLLIHKNYSRGQSFSRIDFNSGGNELSVTDSTFNISFSIGGSFVSTLEPEGFMITQGYQQPDTIFIYVPGDDKILVKVYPIPCRDYLTIKLDNAPSSDFYSFELVSPSSSTYVIANSVFIENKIPLQFDVSRLASGIYWINIYKSNPKAFVSSFKFIKTN